MELPRRQFLHLGSGTVALPVVLLFLGRKPIRPVRIIISRAAGSASDIFARLIGRRLSERLSGQFVIEPPSGGAGNIALEAVIRAPADGYGLEYFVGDGDPGRSPRTVTAKDGFVSTDKTEVALMASADASPTALRLADKLAEFCNNIQVRVGLGRRL
jgi:tripartite-type tricarboxylate transporter receptor subunit TctC